MLNNDILIYETESAKEALKRLDRSAKKVLLVRTDGNKLLGTITDGDLRRYILSGRSLEGDIKKVYNEKPIYMERYCFSKEAAKQILIKHKIELLPIVDEQKKIIDFVTWDQVFSEEEKEELFKKTSLDLPVVIMAGGKGSRLEPFTTILPKPLIPIGDKPIIEIIMDEFRKWGIRKYYLTLNHKAEMIIAYFNTIDEKRYEIKYIKEKTFLGTVGSLKLLEKEIDDNFIVSNCDIIVKANFADVVNFHNRQGAILTILSSIKHYKIPYGIIQFKKEGEIVSILEKPEYTLTVNTGVYIFSKETLNFIPKESPFDMTDLIRTLIKDNKKLVMYPVNENDYIDIGQWEEYRKAIEKLQAFT